MVIDFIDTFKDRFGIEPICRVLSEHGCGIARSTYRASKTRPRSARAARDKAVLAHVVRIHTSPTIGRRLYGARKVWRDLAREQARGVYARDRKVFTGV